MSDQTAIPADGDPDLEAHLDAFQAFGDELRYRILAALREAGELSASDLRERVGGSSAGFHYHLERLEEAGLVANRRRDRRAASGVRSYYDLTDSAETLLAALDELADG